MPTQFGPAFDFMMKHEDPKRSGVVTHDSGGTTRWGISQKAFPHLDIRHLTIEKAADIYRDNYFKPVHGYDYESQDVANKVFDMAVNMGCKRAICLLQQVLGTEEDGTVGPKTLKLANACDPAALLEGLRQASAAHYRVLAQQPKLAQYLPNWLHRAEA